MGISRADRRASGSDGSGASTSGPRPASVRPGGRLRICSGAEVGGSEPNPDALPSLGGVALPRSACAHWRSDCPVPGSQLLASIVGYERRCWFRNCGIHKNFWKIYKRVAFKGSRTPSDCLEGNHANRYTMNAPTEEEEIDLMM